MQNGRTSTAESLPASGRPRAALTIGQASRLAGLPAKTIRYYEEVGVLPRPPRGENSYRRYTTADVHRLLLLRRIRLLGVPLAEARALLAGADDAACADVQDALVALVNDRLTALDREIEELRALRSEVAGYRHALDTCRPQTRMPFTECDDITCIVGPLDIPSDGVPAGTNSCGCADEEGKVTDVQAC